jgi:hypothetical protein
MESVHSECADDDQGFRYQPLANPGSSIRLIKINPELSLDGALQIQLLDAALSEEYTCLSYVWGPKNRNEYLFPILVNGKTFHVRPNLKRFLHIARRKYSERRFWIDAICIDQANTPERNQQVQQMGRIYSEAKEVIAWLGYRERAALFIPTIEGLTPHVFRRSPTDIWRQLWYSIGNIEDVYCFGCVILSRWKLEKFHQMKLESSAFSEAVSEYWTRAWVTQEVALAKHVRLLVHETELDLATFNLSKRLNYRVPIPWSLLQIRSANMRDRNGHNEHLVALLCDYHAKKCEIKRDRVYSLLSICREGAELKVDYSLSEEKFMSTVLRASHLTPCLCSAWVVSESIDDDAISKVDIKAPYFLKFTLQAIDALHATQSTRHSCCSASAKMALREESGGQLFCLSKVCPKFKLHLFVESQELDKQHIRIINSETYYRGARSISLGENGKLVEIHSSLNGDSYMINVTLEGFVKLAASTQHSIYIPKLCSMARQTGCDSNVEFLDLGS